MGNERGRGFALRRGRRAGAGRGGHGRLLPVRSGKPRPLTPALRPHGLFLGYVWFNPVTRSVRFVIRAVAGTYGVAGVMAYGYWNH